MFFDTTIGRNFVRVYAENVVVVCHGLPYEPLPVIAKGYDELAEFFAERGLNSVIFDFSGTGYSKGFFSVENWIKDLIEIVESFKSVQIVAFSLGGVPATYVSRLRVVRSLVLLAVPCCFEVMKEDLIRSAYESGVERGSIKVAGKFEEFYEKFKKDMDEFAPLKWINRIRCPILIVHGDRDDIVPFESSRKLYETAGGRKFFLEVKNGDHRLRKYESVMSFVADWLMAPKEGYAVVEV